jgi:hypothetical protein
MADNTARYGSPAVIDQPLQLFDSSFFRILLEVHSDSIGRRSERTRIAPPDSHAALPPELTAEFNIQK